MTNRRILSDRRVRRLMDEPVTVDFPVGDELVVATVHVELRNNEPNQFNILGLWRGPYADVYDEDGEPLDRYRINVNSLTREEDDTLENLVMEQVDERIQREVDYVQSEMEAYPALFIEEDTPCLPPPPWSIK